MATYVNDLRLKEIATGDESGTWGTSTNTNLELIAEAFSFGTEAITTNADTHTTTIADGSTDPGRSIYLKYTGTLDSDCTITIGPNTVSKLWFIENGTSGSQNIIISQGSGANVTVPAGEVKAIYSDGAGSGAAMVDAFAGLKVSDAAQTNITSLGTLTTLTVDDITIDSSTISDSGDLTLDIGGDIILDADGGNVTFKDGGTAIGDLVNSSSDFVIESKVQDKDIIFKGDDGGSGITALTLDMSDAGKALFNKGGTFNELVTIDGGSTANTVLALDSSTANTFLKITDSNTNEGNFIGCTTDDLTFFTRNSEEMRIDSSGNVLIGATSTNTGGFGSVSPQLLVAGTMPQVALHETDNDKDGYIGIQGSVMFIQTADAIPMRFATSDTERMRIASNGSIGMGTTPPTDTHTGWTQLFIGQKGSVISENATGVHGLDGTFVTDNMYVDSDTGAFAYIEANESSAYRQEAGNHQFFTQASGSAGAAVTLSEKIRIDSAGSIGVGTTSPGTVSGGIHAVHANSEGTPTFDGGEVLILQRNFNSSQSCSMSMVAGTNAACTINMGDKDDVNRSFITSHQGTDTMGFTVATGSALEIVSGRGGGTGRTVSATGNGGLCFGSAETNTGGCLMAAADNAQSEGIVFYLTASASEWQPASIVAHCSKIDSDQSDHNYGNVAYGFSILGNGSLATVQKYEENPSGGAGITWSLNDLGGTTTMQIQILATSDNSTGPRIVLSAWAANYSGVLEANRS